MRPRIRWLFTLLVVHAVACSSPPSKSGDGATNADDGGDGSPAVSDLEDGELLTLCEEIVASLGAPQREVIECQSFDLEIPSADECVSWAREAPECVTANELEGCLGSMDCDWVANGETGEGGGGFEARCGAIATGDCEEDTASTSSSPAEP